MSRRPQAALRSPPGPDLRRRPRRRPAGGVGVAAVGRRDATGTAVEPGGLEPLAQAGYDRNEVMVAKAAKRGGECVALVAPCTEPRCRRTEPHGTHGASHCADRAHAAGPRPCTRPDIGGEAVRVAAEGRARPARLAADRRARTARSASAASPRCAPRARRQGLAVEFLVPGLPATPELPPHFDHGRPSRRGLRHRIGARAPGQPRRPRGEQPTPRRSRDRASGRDNSTRRSVRLRLTVPPARVARATPTCLGCENSARLAAAADLKCGPGWPRSRPECRGRSPAARSSGARNQHGPRPARALQDREAAS